MIDTACGSCGFTVHTLFNVWNKLVNEGKANFHNFSNQKLTSEQLDYVDKVFEIRNSTVIEKVDKKENLRISENSETLKKTKFRWIVPIKNKDYILTLRAGEYCAVLTKGDSGDLYRRFIFDIKDEFLRLVFRKWRSIETRNEFTKSIGDLSFMKELKEENKKEYSNVYGEMTNVIYLELFGVRAIEYKETNNIPLKYFAKDFFTKDWLFDLEKLENKLSAVIGYLQPSRKEYLIWMIFILNLTIVIPL